ncbi:OmpA family protein [Sphingomonas sp.]|jgi:outer membrane protein OmpA-like peptidoglycan-associated protein|uniref:OmpA family protein n=1 Tax=Sphingomonas sp. TaxID=28214 RepID=UPI0035C7D8ED
MRVLMMLGAALIAGATVAPLTAAPLSTAIPAYLSGELVEGRQARVARVKKAAMAGVTSADLGGYMNQQEQALRVAVADSGVRVVRSGDELLLTIPSGINFAYKSATVDPRFAPTLDRVAQVLAKFDRTFVDIYGHTDSIASDGYNLKLSKDRAGSVARYLEARGVAPARVGTQGFGEGEALVSNETEEGRATNRRVEIRIVAIPQIELG